MSNNPQSAFITSVAILLVLVTLYFTTNALKRNYEINQIKLEEENRQREQERQQLEEIRRLTAETELRRQADILAKFKEHQNYCFDLQIFVADYNDDDQPSKITRDQSNQTTTVQHSKKTSRKKDFNKVQQTKKTNSTEPIIYLFVLVLLYLLLKAASDINQHYKEQAKGDKGKNRRCSLHVYAQMKNERRSSRENRLLTMNARSKSVDRPVLQRSKRIYPKLRSYTSVDERSSCSTSTTVIEETTSVQNITPMNLVSPNSRPTSLIISESPSSRRCSVPAVSLQQLGVLNRRRTSIGTLAEDALSLETKKRHRMIQRH